MSRMFRKGFSLGIVEIGSSWFSSFWCCCQSGLATAKARLTSFSFCALDGAVGLLEVRLAWGDGFLQPVRLDQGDLLAIDTVDGFEVARGRLE